MSRISAQRGRIFADKPKPMPADSIGNAWFKPVPGTTLSGGIAIAVAPLPSDGFDVSCTLR